MSDSPLQPELSLLDADVQEDPYETYAILRNEFPVFRDPKTGFYVVSRYDDLRNVLKDTDTFSSDGLQRLHTQVDRRRAMRAAMMFNRKGWLPSKPLGARDDPEHGELRRTFDFLLRPEKVRALDPFVQSIASDLLDRCIAQGQCDWVAAYAVPMPMTVIGLQMGAREEDLGKIKVWVEAAAKRFGLMSMDDDDDLRLVELEIEAQHYFKPIFDDLRRHPNGTLLSDLANSEVAEWGRPMSDNEILTEVVRDFFGAGSETTTNAISAGLRILAENDQIWALLKADPEKYMKPFVEEILRIESPVQGLYRITTRDVTMHDVVIPQWSIINVRFAAGNRDERKFVCPADVDLNRAHVATHLAFGSGIHHCVGSGLARRELHWTFMGLTSKVRKIELVPGKNNFRHSPSYILRALKELHMRVIPE